ncbi:hypothetical protein ID866_6819 [Astraeus odoratus]|nr:hypothetical protein ID866_6819 [Astraeus odoratus]
MPTTPQTPFQWDSADAARLEQQVLQHPLQHQQQHPHQPQDAYATSSTATIQDLVPVVPSQEHARQHEREEFHPHHLPPTPGPSMRHPEHMRPKIHVDTVQMHVGTSVSPPSGPPSAGAVYQGTGPIRARASPSHVDARSAAHPYRRPQSAGTGALRSRREHEETQQSVRPQVPRQALASNMPAPAAPPSSRLPPYSGTASAATSLVSPAHAVSLPRENQRFIIRTDVHYDSDMRLLTAMLELPGLTKSDLSIVLSTCYYNGVKQVVVSGRSRPVFSGSGYAVRERKFGEFTRTLVVSHDTKPEDVTAEMQDGVLTIKINLPPPPEGEPSEQEIPVQ